MKSKFVVVALVISLPLSAAWSAPNKAASKSQSATAKANKAKADKAKAQQFERDRIEAARVAAEKAEAARLEAERIETEKAKTATAIMVAGTKVWLPHGTKVRLEIQEMIRGNKAQIGQEVHYLIKEAVTGTDGKILIAQGAKAIGRVTNRKGAKGFGKSSELEFNAESVTSVDGTQVPLIFQYKKDARNKGIIRATSIFNPFGKGGDAKVKKGTIFDAVTGIPTPQPVNGSQVSGANVVSTGKPRFTNGTSTETAPVK
jgi:prolyl oligopeptidase PreP (S9A serine peptidase family)